MSIYDNIAYGPRIHGVKKRSELDHIVRVPEDARCGTKSVES